MWKCLSIVSKYRLCVYVSRGVIRPAWLSDLHSLLFLPPPLERVHGVLWREGVGICVCWGLGEGPAGGLKSLIHAIDKPDCSDSLILQYDR